MNRCPKCREPLPYCFCDVLEEDDDDDEFGGEEPEHEQHDS